MKLLFDQNLSPWLCSAVADRFPGAEHVRGLGLREASDATIWEFAVLNGFAIVTKDADFRQRSFVEGHPPKVIWVRLGNCTTKAVAALLLDCAAEIEEFLRSERASFLALS